MYKNIFLTVCIGFFYKRINMNNLSVYSSADTCPEQFVCLFVVVVFFFLCFFFFFFFFFFWGGGGGLCFCCVFFIPRHTIVAGYYGFTLDVRVSVRPCVCPSVRPSYVRPSVFRFRMIT